GASRGIACKTITGISTIQADNDASSARRLTMGPSPCATAAALRTEKLRRLAGPVPWAFGDCSVPFETERGRPPAAASPDGKPTCARSSWPCPWFSAQALAAGGASASGERQLQRLG